MPRDRKVQSTCSISTVSGGEGKPLNGTPAGWGNGTHSGPIIADQGLGMEARLYDFANAATRQYFLDVVMKPFLDAAICDGVIFDEVTWLMHEWRTPYYVESSTLGTPAQQQACCQKTEPRGRGQNQNREGRRTRAVGGSVAALRWARCVDDSPPGSPCTLCMRKPPAQRKFN